MPEPSPHNPLGEPFVELDSIDSTNNYALARLHAGMAPHGSAFFAWEQYAGKGQRGKPWWSERGNNLILSIVLNPAPLLLSDQFQLSACVAVATAEWFSRYAGDATRIKWPNDLYWQDRKAGGILIESIIGGTDSDKSAWKWAVTGIGININQVSFNPELRNPVSLRQITGKQFDARSMAVELCAVMDQHWNQLLLRGPGPLLERYQQLLFRRGERSAFRQGNRRFEARVEGVDEFGRLLLKNEWVTPYEFGSLEWII